MVWLTLTAFFLLLVSWVTKKLHHILGLLTLICLIFGIVLGYFHQIPPLKAVQALSQIPLVLFLFIDGIRIHVPKIIHYHREAFRQLTIGFFIQVFLGAVLAYYFLALPWMASILLALALATIDLKATPMPIESKRVPSRIAQVLNLETSVTPILTVLLFMVFKAKCFVALLLPIPFGVALGYVIIHLTRIALKSHMAHRPFVISSLFVAPFALFYLCECLRLNGYVGVIALALTIGHAGRSLCDGLFDFGRRQGRLLFFLFIITFGCQILGSLAHSLTGKMIFYAVLSLFVIRFLGVMVSFWGSKFQWKTVCFCAFFGPRALVPAALALLALPYDLQVYATLYGAVLISLLFHTLFSFSVTYWYSHAILETGKAEFLPTVSFPH
ncbi:cation:proton antiporter domain-containing protein [Simkania negevensis]|uniref:Cation/H+ exchanger transmembrane domain-containing protein n=1 Tax=Simkania negevensis (strain ATCC VR-1471 / DSM 27360 / Z) TaxID=331113 RepID=F8L8T6_SIMNZ|nr:cation:proton antiporter [Simkania negevensis]CCB89229.1 hypothetical protein SNE_A13520 [Simkania negevensis Z]